VGRQGYPSGHYGRTLITRVGKLELRVPQDRMGRFSTELFERYQRSERALVAHPSGPPSPPQKSLVLEDLSWMHLPHLRRMLEPSPISVADGRLRVSLNERRPPRRAECLEHLPTRCG
jgi:hypothetical protein